MNAPTLIGDDEDSVHVVGHDDPYIQFDGGEMVRNGQPALLCDRAVGSIVEHRRAVVGANGHEVGALLRIVIASEADGTATMPVLIECHVAFPHAGTVRCSASGQSYPPPKRCKTL